MFSVLLLAGCAHFEPQPLEPEQTAAQLESRRLNDPGLEKFLQQNLGQPITDWPKTNWNLPELTLVAFYFHPSLEVARAQWLVATAGLKTAGARPNPSVSFTPAYDTQIPGNYSPWLLPVTFDVPIETAGKRGKRLAEAAKISESARWNYVSAAWQIRSGVRASLLDFNTAGRRAELLQTQFAGQKKIVSLLQGRFDAGEISHPELTAAQIALHKTRIDFSDAQSKQADARSRLAQSLGLTEAALAGENFDFSFSPGNAAELNSARARQVALRSRADILAALADYAAAEADLRLQVAKQYPDLHLGPGYAWNSGNAGDNEWSLGLTLELPVLDQNQGPIAEAEARRKLAAAKFIELQSQVAGEIDRAVAGWHVALDQLQTGKEMLAAELRQQKSAEAQRAAGAGDQLDLLTAQLELINASLTQIDNETKFLTASGALEDALQQPADSLAAAVVKLSAEDPEGKSSHP
ncbi:MAG TPA: TolC family protein [Verrucomicrobiae bacterium]|nr:TolC family protein [Verrucomicrobiae bacterium]